MARRRHSEEHVNHEAWAIPYADLMTLLLAFFVVMYAISSVNEGKYRVLADSLTSAFTGTPRTLDPFQVGDVRPSDSELVQPMPISVATRGGPDATRGPLDPPLQALIEATRSRGTGNTADAAALDAARRQLMKLSLQLEDELAEMVAARMITIERADLWLEVEINSDILFPTASDVLDPEARDLLARLARLLRDEPNPVRVEGHTDSRPISSYRFPSNWELSAARAASVVHLFIGEQVPPDRLVMVGYGEHRPKVDNDGPAGHAANRRVVLMVLAAPDVPGAHHADLPPAVATTDAEPAAGEEA